MNILLGPLCLRHDGDNQSWPADHSSNGRRINCDQGSRKNGLRTDRSIYAVHAAPPAAFTPDLTLPSLISNPCPCRSQPSTSKPSRSQLSRSLPSESKSESDGALTNWSRVDGFGN